MSEIRGYAKKARDGKLSMAELTGGTYVGEPKKITILEDGQKRAVDTTVYTTVEIERIIRTNLTAAAVLCRLVLPSMS